ALSLPADGRGVRGGADPARTRVSRAESRASPCPDVTRGTRRLRDVCYASGVFVLRGGPCACNARNACGGGCAPWACSPNSGARRAVCDAAGLRSRRRLLSTGRPTGGVLCPADRSREAVPAFRGEG